MSVSGEARGGFPSNNQPITMLLLLLMVTTTKIMKIMMKAVERAQWSAKVCQTAAGSQASGCLTRRSTRPAARRDDGCHGRARTAGEKALYGRARPPAHALAPMPGADGQRARTCAGAAAARRCRVSGGSSGEGSKGGRAQKTSDDAEARRARVHVCARAGLRPSGKL